MSNPRRQEVELAARWGLGKEVLVLNGWTRCYPEKEVCGQLLCIKGCHTDLTLCSATLPLTMAGSPSPHHQVVWWTLHTCAAQWREWSACSNWTTAPFTSRSGHLYSNINVIGAHRLAHLQVDISTTRSTCGHSPPPLTSTHGHVKCTWVVWVNYTPSLCPGKSQHTGGWGEAEAKSFSGHSYEEVWRNPENLRFLWIRRRNHWVWRWIKCCVWVSFIGLH